MELCELLQAVRDNPESLVVPASWGRGVRVSAAWSQRWYSRTCAPRCLKDARCARWRSPSLVRWRWTSQPVRGRSAARRQGGEPDAGPVVQDGRVVTIVQGSFGAPRSSVIDVPAEPGPSMPPVEACRELPYVPGVTPEFTRYPAMRWVSVACRSAATAPARWAAGFVSVATFRANR